MLKVSEIEVRYSGVPVIHNVSLEVNQGELVSVVDQLFSRPSLAPSILLRVRSSLRIKRSRTFPQLILYEKESPTSQRPV